jgi:hypothetical protein
MTDRKLNLGAGNEILQGYINHDIKLKKGIDTCFDVNSYPLPLKSNQFDEIVLGHILVYVKDLPKFFDEIYRISRDKAILKVSCAHVSSNLCLSAYMYHAFCITSLQELEGVVESGHGKGRFKILEKNLVFREKSSFWFMKLIGKPLDFLANLNYRTQLITDRYVAKFIPFYHIHWKIMVTK